MHSLEVEQKERAIISRLRVTLFIQHLLRQLDTQDAPATTLEMAQLPALARNLLQMHGGAQSWAAHAAALTAVQQTPGNLLPATATRMRVRLFAKELVKYVVAFERKANDFLFACFPI